MDLEFDYKPLSDILEKTRNVLIYQETYMLVLNQVFGFDMKRTNAIRKVLAKKKKDDLKKLEPEIRKAGKDNGVPKDAVDYCWKSMLASADYSFAKCLDPASIVETKKGLMTICDVKIGDNVLSYNEKYDRLEHVEVIGVHESRKELWEFEFEDGRKIRCSLDHKFLTTEGEMMSVKKIIEKGVSIVCKDQCELCQNKTY